MTEKPCAYSPVRMNLRQPESTLRLTHMSVPLALPHNPNSSVHLWRSMTADRYAALSRLMGAVVYNSGTIWWKRTHGVLYRPLLPFQTYDLEEVRSQFTRFGAVQYGVMDGQVHNSYLNFFVFDDVRDYDMKKLHRGTLWNLRLALKNKLEIRAFADETEFSDKARDVYMSAYRRTHYNPDPRRLTKAGFEIWAHTLFGFPELVVTGVFSGSELVSFGTSCVVNETLILNSGVHSPRALELRAPDALLHYWRSNVRQNSQISRIYDGMLAFRPGINDFKLRRGGRALALPAFLDIDRFTLWLAHKLGRSIRKRLFGLSAEELAHVLRQSTSTFESWEPS